MSAPTAATSSATSTAISVMLAIHEKKTVAVDLHRPLRQYVVLHYSEREAQNLGDDLDFVCQARSSLEKPSNTESPSSRRDTLQSYYRALCAVESRFPISPDRNHVNTVSFTWYDAFKPSKRAAQQNVYFEKAAVLFNLGAVYSQIALSADRSNAAGLKQACNSFQAAAGAFAFLRDNVSIKASAGNMATMDVSAECAGMLERLMLAQAQECFFEKVTADGKPSGLCSKVSRQVALYYEEAYTALSSPPLNQHFDRSWISHVQLKAAQFYAEACYRIGLDLHEKEDISLEIVRLRAGISALADAKKTTKGVATPLLDAVAKLENKMNRNLERAVKENERVYLMRIPAQDTLTPLPAASLVKPVDMSEIFDASKERLFANLIPDSSAKALSRYTEMVDDIIRTQAEKLQQGSEITRVRLKEMDLPESILALEGNLSLPIDLKESVEDVQATDGPHGLQDELQQLRDLRRVNQEILVQTEEMLQKEETEDSQFQTQFGTRIPRKPSNTMTMNLKDRLNKFAANLKQAADSDAHIERALKDNSELLAVLNSRPIESALPNLARPIMSLDGNEDAILGALKQSLRQLEALGAQRAGLEDMLKDMKRKDDILPKLMANTGSNEDLFRKEISKYDPVCEEIAQNIEAQEQLLLQIQAQNEEFSAVFNLEDYRVSREKCYKQIAAAVAKFREIKDNINEGLKFYVTLQDAINNVKQQCSDFVMSRNLEFKQLIESVQKKIAGLSFPPDGKAGYNYPPASQPSFSNNITPPADSRMAPPSGYNYPPTGAPNPPSMQQRVDPRGTPQSLGFNYTHGQPGPVNTNQQVDPRSTQPPSGYNYPPPGANTPQPVEPRDTPGPPNQSPYHQAPPEHTRAGYSQSYSPYGASQQPLYSAPPSGSPYQPPQQQPHHEYGQPAYPGWHGQYYNAPPQQSGSYTRPPYTIPSSYPQHQGGYYKPQ